MPNEALIATVKSILALGKANKEDEMFEGYKNLFSSAEFRGYRPEDQRQALKLMIHAKRPGKKATPAFVEAHRVASVPLTDLVAQHGDAGDHELLGICLVVLGDEKRASEIFRTGLAIEREHNATSDLVGALMTRISAL